MSPEDFIVCEKQQLLFCGRHALRALVQNTHMFDDTYLMSLGEEFSTQELIIREDATTFNQFYFNQANGYYHIEVVRKALRQQYNIELVQLNRIDETLSSIRDLINNHIHDVQALFIHKHDHYFCVRRFDKTTDYFFIIDSLRPNRHETIKRNLIHEYIKYLHKHNNSVYIPVCIDILQTEIIPSDLISSLIHPLPICEADRIVLTVNDATNFIFN